MDKPVEVLFHGIEKSDAIETRVREKVAKLERHFERMTHCRVVLDVPHRNPTKAKVYQVKIEVGIPGRNDMVITHEREGAHASDDLSLAVRDAFEIAVRHLDDERAKFADRVRSERTRRRPAPNGRDE